MLDGTFLLAVKQEMEPLVGSRIDKISQPSRDEILLSFRRPGGADRVLISTSGTGGRVHISDARPENPKTPPMFCMLLRKHLTGGKLTAVRQEGLERILFLDLETVNELGDTETITLVCEIMGKYSNLIAVRENGKIIDALHRLDDITAQRLILPGVTYTMPDRRPRLNFLISSVEEMTDAFAGIQSGSLSKGLIGVFEGISPILAREWVFDAFNGREPHPSELTRKDYEALAERVMKSRDLFLSGNRCYCVLYEQGRAKDLCFEDIRQYGSLYEKKVFPTACSLLDSFYSEGAVQSRLKQRFSELYKLISSLCTRTLRRLENRRLELSRSEEGEKYKLMGDLLSANLYRVQKGDALLECENFYDESLPPVKIELDEMLTPSQNMQLFYRRYRRAETAREKLTELIGADEQELMYLESVKDFADRAQTEAEIDSIRSELSEQGYIRRSSKRKKEKPVKLSPAEYSIDGFTVLVGRNNRQNDELTHKTARKSDMWLHVKDITGSHVIIRSDDREIPPQVIEKAARIAAFHSSGRGSSSVPVDYTFVKFVKKPAGAKPGMVIFTNNRTLYVTPERPGEENK